LNRQSIALSEAAPPQPAKHNHTTACRQFSFPRLFEQKVFIRFQK
jgi:hypothetical protein